MKTIEIKIFYTQDYDLMLLHKYGHINFRHAIREVLYAYVYGKDPDIPIFPRRRDLVCRYYYRIHVSFDLKRDRAVLEMLDTLDDKPRSSFIKTLLRVYLGFTRVDLFLEKDSFHVSYRNIKNTGKANIISNKSEKVKYLKEKEVREQVEPGTKNTKEHKLTEQPEIEVSEDKNTEDELTYLFMDMLGV